jgi:hypothetical protein
MDTTTNKQKEHRVVITGITSSIAPLMDPGLKKEWIRDIVLDIFKSIIPDFGGEIIYMNQGKNNGRYIPLVEVKLNSVKNATLIRKTIAEKKKRGTDFGRLFIANSINLATRVRVDVLKALARKISAQNVVAYALPFVSRPTLQVRSTDATSTEVKTFTFMDAIAKYGHLLKQLNLGEAYRRAGSFFRGQLEQQFMVLKETGSMVQLIQQPVRQQQQQQGQPQRGRRGHGKPQRGGSRKRNRDDDDDDQHGWYEHTPRGAGSHARGNTSGQRRPFRGNKFSRR